ncbi:YadA-like family protein [Stenotrophomonas sp.]|uniref:YadA-like family protein n=1 Tax=Stenotrophomonas sp. TaxID=69392 RepID=UPI002FC8D585
MPQATTSDGLLVVNAGSNASAASVNGINMIAIGSNAVARPASNGANNSAVALGSNAVAAGSYAVSIGYGAAADSQNGSGTSGATSLGASTRSTWNATAIGFQANGSGTVVTALGAAAAATGERGIALGRAATATGQYTAAIGAGARATHANSVAIGAGSASRGNATVAMGSTTLRRGIAQLADGSQVNDVVNLQQLQGLLQATGGSVSPDGSVVAPHFTLAQGGTHTTIGSALSALDDGVSSLDVTVNDLHTRIRQGTLGVVQQTMPGADLAVGADRDGSAVGFAGTTGARRLTGVADAVADDQAINKAQADTRVASAAAALGAGAGVAADGTLRAPEFHVVGTTVHTVGDALQALETQDGAQRADLVDLGSAVGVAQRYFQANAGVIDARASAGGTGSAALGSGAEAGGQQSLALGADARATGQNGVALGAGAQASGLGAVALGAGSVADRDQVVSLGGGAVGMRQLVNVANGTDATDVVNRQQLQAVVAALGGGAQIDVATGNVTGPTYVVQGGRYDNAGAALGAVDGQLQALDLRITDHEDDILDIQGQVDAWNGGDAGLVRQDATSGRITVAADRAGSVVDLTGTAGARQVKGLAAATDATDAVTLAQLQDGLSAAQPEDSRYLKVDGRGDGSDDASINAAGALAVGASARADGAGAIALGQGAQATAESAVALGAGSVADRANAVSIGRAGAERQITHVADASADTDAVNLRQLKSAGLVGEDGQVNETVGYVAGSNRSQVAFAGTAGTVLANVADGRVQRGSREAVNGGQLAVIGDRIGRELDGLQDRVTLLDGQPADAAPADMPYYGATGNDALVADGAPAVADGQGAVAAGSGAQGRADNSVALGSDAIADRADSVSVGHAGSERQIAHVAAGSADTDAVNVAQLQEQMASVNRYTDQRVEAMEQAMGVQTSHMSRQINRGIAASAALVQVTPNLPGKVTLNFGTATYRGESALALGLSRWSRDGRYNLNGGVSVARGDQPLLSVGFGMAFD